MGVTRCVYCGRHVVGLVACGYHADLIEHDPHYTYTEREGGEMTKQILVQTPPTDVLDALIAEAQARDVSVQEAVVSMLADRYGLKQPAGSGRRFTGGEYTRVLSIELPENIHKKVKVEAAKGDGTMRGVIIDAVASALNVESPGIKRRPRVAA